MFSASVASLVRENVSLADHCWLKIGGTAKYFAEIQTPDQLSELVADANKAELPIRILGAGSNVLVQTELLDAVVVRLAGEFANIGKDGESIVAGGAALLGDVVTFAAEQGLAGLEHLAGIPGTLGAAVVCNSGIVNDDIGSHVLSVEGIKKTGEPVSLDRDSLRFGYRRSNLEGTIVTTATLQLQPQDPTEITRRLQTNWIVKKAAQPGTDQQVAQAFFEPTGSQISELLDASGMRSASESDAIMISQFPGFLQVGEKATANDVLALTNRIARAVEVQSGIQLQPQLKIW